ncbi:serine protease [Paenibacillus sp. CAA11]|uniref:S1C family serine protease n=1 Tax=Paenibacillus sp. CAA11 TaxID=1532905 RepID=UPI000D3C91C9|nr:trypsin-like peptidase domain-containing protein [Paenibacillus sp. CAA11]AWB46679.1 serine protease [Paenibacillus sp. CAA11]
MGLFDDDFYSTKVSRRAVKAQETDHKWRSPRRSRPRNSSTVKIAVICSILSSVVAVLLFSFVTGLPSTTQEAGARSGSGIHSSGDPYERLIQAAAKVRPAVVSIVNHQASAEEAENAKGDAAALGSGVVIKKEKGKAYVVTNNHVIADADNLEVVTVSGSSIKAKVVGKDPVSDIALLEIEDKGIDTVAEIGDSKKLRWGETVIAVGNPLGLSDTLTSGIISYTNRIIPVSINQDGVYDWEQEVIQTDAAINEGNSGGALVDLDGQVIGINTMKISDMGVEGIGFAIPVNEVMKTVDDLMLDGKVSRPYLGVYSLDLDNPYSPVTDEQRKELKLPDSVKKGVVVLEAHGPAAKAALELNDVITELDKNPIESTLDLRKYLYEDKKIGEDMEVGFYRDGKLQHVTVTLTDKPADADIDEDQGTGADEGDTDSNK